MPTRRFILEHLTRQTLLDLASSFELRGLTAKRKEEIVAALSSTRGVETGEILAQLYRDDLKYLCEAAGLDTAGRSRQTLIDRILGTAKGDDRASASPAHTEPKDTPPMMSENGSKTGSTAPSPPSQNGRKSNPKLTLPQLERHLFAAADILRGKMDASEFKEYIFGMLFLKRCSDVFEAERQAIIDQQLQRGRSQAEAEKRADRPDYYKHAFFVPSEARWRHLRDELHQNVGDGLNKALGKLEEENSTLEGVLHHIDFTRTVGRSRLPDKKLRELIQHFNKYRLLNEDFEFPDLLGAAYEYLIGEFADSAGKKGGEFYTPRAVVRMMVRLAEPEEGMRIYDPCSGSGGMLILSREQVAENGGNPRNLRLFGQESNGSVWSISQMNMILHGVPDADIRNGDTLAEPQHVEGGELMRFDRVITNPPFSQNYSDEGIPFPERFRHGWCPTNGKKADLMFVQHMLSVLNRNGMVCTVMPHGVLFRGGAEKQIRQSLVADDQLEAVIGLAPNLFYGTGIPACILVLRAKGAKPRERRDKVLFINADAEYHPGRAQNYLEPEHIEKIAAAFERFEDIPAFARVVTRDELAENEHNLNIRRYADNAPPPEPHDVRAHVVGGVPRSEVEARAGLFDAHGFDPAGTLFVERDEDYFDFREGLNGNGDLKSVVENDSGIQARERALSKAFDNWWNEQRPNLINLPRTQALMDLRTRMLQTFEEALLPVGLLDRFQLTGALATWWYPVRFDLKTLMARGFSGVVDGWVTTIVAAVDGQTNTPDGADPLEHKLPKRLMPEFVEELAEAEALAAELDASIKAAESPTSDGEEGENEDDDAVAEESDEESTVSPEELKKLKKQRSDARQRIKRHRQAFVKKLREAQQTLGDTDAQTLVLELLREGLEEELNRRVAAHRQAIVDAIQNWWNKYRVTLREIESERDTAKEKLDSFLEELGYV